ncbi:MAG: phosphoribosylformylglycinamidine synthase subunit PurQ [Phycisphaeraceae bacterium]|nr:phosphoribosylformylglycinamidine synthase subunit PurQ [Phycisphaeraceae bacterium]
MKPRTLIIRTAGTNCDVELAHAFELAGAATETIHLNRLIEQPQLIDGFDLIGFPGGFSYGDDIAAGRIFANRIRHHLMQPLQQAVERGVPMIGICNGFQVMVKMGLLPDPRKFEQTVTLADNTCGRFIDRWVKLSAAPESVCIWTKGLGEFDLPIAHGEGRFTPGSEQYLIQLRENRQITLRYTAGDNPNGSVDDIAGICDPSGLVLGLMPHPERFCAATNHPRWTAPGRLTSTPAGLQFFRNAVEHVSAAAASV